MSFEHPRLEPAQVRDFIDKVVSRGSINEDAVRGFLVRLGVGEIEEAAAIDRVVRDIVDDCGTLVGQALEPVEARHCRAVFDVLDPIPPSALGDVAFWSFLAVRHFWPFIARRQHAAWTAVRGQPGNPDEPQSERQKLERYVIGKDHYQLPLRMYLRAQAVRDVDDFSLTEIDGGGTDFWRSQVLGVRTSLYPSVARSVARAQADQQLDIDGQRPPGRRVNRLRANIEFIDYSDNEAMSLIEPLWLVTDEDRAAAEAKRKAKKAAG